VIDCRSFLEYNDNHIVGAVNICCSKLIKRRLQQEKVTTFHVFGFIEFLHTILSFVMGCVVVIGGQGKNNSMSLKYSTWVSMTSCRGKSAECENYLLVESAIL